MIILWSEVRSVLRRPLSIHHICKFDRLQEKIREQQHHEQQQQGVDKKRWVVNLSSYTLTDAEEQVLQRGLNYATVPRRIPYMDFIASVEGVARRMNIEEANDLRVRVCGILRRAKLPPSNLRKEERRALRTLKNNNSIVVLPADKGNATVEMDAAAYEEKITILLKDPVYKKVKRDPTAAIEWKVLKEVRELEKKHLLSKALGTRLKPSSSRSPKLYGLLKIHKPEVPLRPIVSCIDSPTYQLAKHITTLIIPLAGQTSFL